MWTNALLANSVSNSNNQTDWVRMRHAKKLVNNSRLPVASVIPTRVPIPCFHCVRPTMTTIRNIVTAKIDVLLQVVTAQLGKCFVSPGTILVPLVIRIVVSLMVKHHLLISHCAQPMTTMKINFVMAVKISVALLDVGVKWDKHSVSLSKTLARTIDVSTEATRHRFHQQHHRQRLHQVNHHQRNFPRSFPLYRQVRKWFLFNWCTALLYFCKTHWHPTIFCLPSFISTTALNPSISPTLSPTVQPDCGCPDDCPEVWDNECTSDDGQVATCGERILFYQTITGGGFSEKRACKRTIDECTSECSKCNPDNCGETALPTLSPWVPKYTIDWCFVCEVHILIKVITSSLFQNTGPNFNSNSSPHIGPHIEPNI